MNEQGNDIFKICVRCITYNQANYITDTLNGFAMQETDFPFVCCVIDDGSSDGEQDLIKEYLYDNCNLTDKYVARNEETDDYFLIFAQHKTNRNCYFAVYLLKYNHYSIKKLKTPYISKWIGNAQYIALCEGDDYWINSKKLQRQIEYMVQHPECTMTCTRAKRYLVTQERFLGEQFCRDSDGFLDPVDVIRRSGYYIATCSIVYRPSITENYPDYCHNCFVGDWPLQIMASMKGYVFYFDECMCVYRYMSKNSWSSNQKFGTIDPERLHIVSSQSKMFEGFSNDYPKYKDVFDDMNSYFVISNIPKWNTKKADKQLYLEMFSHVLDKLPSKFIPYYLISKMRIPVIKTVFKLLFYRKYKNRCLYYDSLLKRAFMKCLRLIRIIRSSKRH